jgi:kynurenine formamidase
MMVTTIETEALPTEDEVLAMWEAVKNWGRWGDDDQRGTLNLITDAHRVRAAALVKDGFQVSCALPFDTKPSIRNRDPAQHHTLLGGDVAEPKGYAMATDFIGIAPHGPAHTHLDALCHVMFDGKMYNGYPASMVTSQGARKNDVTVAAPSVAARGILLDMPAFFGSDYVRADHHIRRADLEACEAKAGLKVEPGDVVLIRKGRHTRYAAEGPECEKLDGRTHMAGLHPDCLAWLHDRGVALLGSDAAHDILPTPWTTARVPIHVGTLVYMGLHLLDNAQLDALAEACAARSRWEFQFIMAPLLIEGGTASPVNPIAIF